MAYKKGVPLNLDHFLIRARASGDWQKKTISKDEFEKILSSKIDTVNIARVKGDIERFIPGSERIEIWSAQYFHDLVKNLVIQ